MGTDTLELDLVDFFPLAINSKQIQNV